MTSTRRPTTITAHPGTPFLEISREFDAPRALVFRAWTDPEYVVRWLGPRDLRMDIEEWDARTGGGYRYAHSRDDFTVHFRGVFHTVRTDELLIQTFEFDGAPDQVATEAVRFEDLGERCRVVTRSVFPSVEALEEAMRSGMTGGVEQSMERLDEVLAQLR